jgi:signal transduction histidine kinase/streptogramin lyase
MRLLHDREGNLWVATYSQGLWQVRDLSNNRSTPMVRRATARTGMLSDEGSAFLEDRAGNIWVGADQGLNRLTPLKLSHVVDIGVVVSIAIGGDGTVWTGTASRLIAIAPSIANVPGQVRVIGSSPVRTVHAASDGTIWAATAEGLQSVVNGRLRPASISGPPLTRITSIASDRRGAVWVIDEQQGLVHLANGHRDRIAAATAGLSARPLFVHIDGGGRAWVAFEGGVVRAIDTDGLVHQYGTAEGLPHTTVYAIQDDELGNVWVGGNGGLSLLGGDRFHTLAMGQGPPEVLAMTTDNIGSLWIADRFRILRFGRDDLVKAMRDPSFRLRYAEYAEREGVAGAPRWLSADNAARAPNGTLWFVTARGLTVVDTVRLQNELSAPPERPRIEGATADERRVRADAGALLAPRTGRLRIDYTLLSLSSSNFGTRFRYRLDGFDTDWVDGTTTRQAFYTNLSPGPYRFRLQAMVDSRPDLLGQTNRADWDQGETTWSFSIQPMFYQTAWFYGLSAVALVLIAVSAWQLRLHQVRRAFSAVFDERMRVSREIHDTLLQSFVGIGLQLDSASRDLDDSSSGVREQLVRARKQIEECVTEARNSIWDLRSPALDKEGLIGALRTAGERLTAGKLRFSLTVTGTPRQIPSNLEMQLVRIGHEAVMNTVRHSHAQRVQVEVGFDDRFVRLHVSDDGWGFDPERQKPNGTATHYGLVMMRERAACAGGRCTIESSPGSGVQVFAEFPLLPQA